MIDISVNLNLSIGWLWILFGFLSGSLIGFNFHFLKENWLDGYSSPKRRLFRLGHISFFGLGFVNLIYYFTFNNLLSSSVLTDIASLGFVIGAITMPLCCFSIGVYPPIKNVFYIPVVSLILSCIITVWEIFNI